MKKKLTIKEKDTMNILWIDDDKFRLKVVIEVLELYAWEINHIADPNDGTNEIEKNLEAYDAIILDIMMPPGKKFLDKKNPAGEITGLLIYEAIRKIDKNKPILMFTILRDSDLYQKYINGDKKVAWLNKPAEAIEIINKINEILK